MDDEDLAEIREGQKLVDMNDEMDFGTQAERKGNEPEKEYVCKFHECVAVQSYPLFIQVLLHRP